jgi:hypothetical protein
MNAKIIVAYVVGTSFWLAVVGKMCELVYKNN